MTFTKRNIKCTNCSTSAVTSLIESYISSIRKLSLSEKRSGTSSVYDCNIYWYKKIILPDRTVSSLVQSVITIRENDVTFWRFNEMINYLSSWTTSSLFLLSRDIDYKSKTRLCNFNLLILWKEHNYQRSQM